MIRKAVLEREKSCLGETLWGPARPEPRDGKETQGAHPREAMVLSCNALMRLWGLLRSELATTS